MKEIFLAFALILLLVPVINKMTGSIDRGWGDSTFGQFVGLSALICSIALAHNTGLLKLIFFPTT